MRTIVREMRILTRRTDRVERLAQKVARTSVGPRIEYAKPSTSLQVGGTCEAILMPWNGTAYAVDDRLVIQIEDLHAWAFAVGTANWAGTPHVLPVIESPKRGFFEVAYPYGLEQQGKPDSTITSGSSGTVSIYAGVTDTGVNITGNVNWADSGDDVTSGKESFWKYSLEQAQWNWIGGECE